MFDLPGKPVVIGRSEGVEIQLLDARVSRRHAVIRESVAGFMIQDMSTKNGTFVNKESVDKSLLFHGDTIIIGAYTLQFQDGGSQELPSEFADKVEPRPARAAARPLSVPRALADRSNTSPRARTQNSPQGPPAERVSRLDRKAPRPPRATSIPIIEGLGDDAETGDELVSFGSLDLAEIDIEIT